MRPIQPRMLAHAAMLALLIASPAAALTKELGPIAGFSYSNLNISGQSGLNGRASVALGAELDLGFNEHFGLRIDPMFVSKGAEATHRNAYWGTMDGAKFNLNYIDVPVLARYDLPAKSEAHGYLLGGVGVSFATKREVDLTQGNEHETVDFKDVLSSTDASVDLGIGFSLPQGPNRWAIDARAAFGVTNINSGGTVTFNGGPLVVPATSTHTIGFRTLVSYLFKL